MLGRSEQRLGTNRSTANFYAAGDVADMRLRAVLSLLPGGFEVFVISSYEVFLRLSAGVSVGPESVVSHTMSEVQFNMASQKEERERREILRGVRTTVRFHHLFMQPRSITRVDGEERLDNILLVAKINGRYVSIHR